MISLFFFFLFFFFLFFSRGATCVPFFLFFFFREKNFPEGWWLNQEKGGEKMKAPMQIRNAYKVRLVSHAVAQFINRGQAIEGKIQTVLNDLKSETGLKSLKNLDGAKIEQYLESLQARVEQGELSGKTAATYVSALNAVINYINHHLDKELENVSAKEWGLSVGHRDYNIDKSVSQEAHQTFLNWLEQKAQETGNVNYRALAHSVELQREFGLRARESFCLKVVEKDTTADKLQITREDMPKNARPREIEIRTDAQRQALESARQFAQENGWRSLISPDMSLKEWKAFAYNAVNEFRQETGYTNYHFHGKDMPMLIACIASSGKKRQAIA